MSRQLQNFSSETAAEPERGPPFTKAVFRERLKKRCDTPSERQGWRQVAGADGRNWTKIDLSNAKIPHLSLSLFRMSHLTVLYVNNNRLYELGREIALLKNLKVLDASQNGLRELPPEIGTMRNLTELLLFNNSLTTLPYELGNLFKLRVLGLSGNPLIDPVLSYAQEGIESLMTYLLDNAPIPPHPPPRPLIRPSNVDLTNPELNSAPRFSVFCFNVLCDKYATRQLYGYCPTWALDWEKYRRQLILKEILEHTADIICLQEVETSEHYDYFYPELQARGYNGVFRPKSRSRTMKDSDRQSVDGCAIFYRSAEFKLTKEYFMEFERLATKHANGCAAMLNRVMPKDNIAIGLMLEHKSSGNKLFVANAHLTWDPQFKDVKVIQTALLLNEIKTLLASQKASGIPVLVTGDFNSLQDSGVFELMYKSKLLTSNQDLKGHDYSKFLSKVPLSHDFKLKTAYTSELPYTNFTYEFTGVIDYVWYKCDSLLPVAVLGPVDPEYMAKFDGCPNSHFPSDHLSLLVDFAFL